MAFMIHLQPERSFTERTPLEFEIGDMDGVMSAHFIPHFPHIMEVAYNPDVVSSGIVMGHLPNMALQQEK